MIIDLALLLLLLCNISRLNYDLWNLGRYLLTHLYTFSLFFQALIEANFLWDSSISTKQTEAPIWPYTLDYAIPHECKIESCPTKSFPGVWELPVNIHMVPDLGGGPCSYLDQCVFALQDGEDVFKWLKLDFKRHYDVRIAQQGPIWGKIGLPYMCTCNVNSG